MRLITPLLVSEITRTACNITEESTTWNSGTAYNPGDMVCLGSGSGVHRWYVARLANTNKQPDQYEGFEDPAYWREVYGTNGWRLFDQRSSVPETKTGGDITATVEPNLDYDVFTMTTVAFLNPKGASVRVRMTDPVEGVVYDETKSVLALDHIYDYYSWFFEPTAYLPAVVFDYLPPYQNAVFEVFIYRGARWQAECGEVVIGHATWLGITQYGSTIRLNAFSKTVYVGDSDNGGGPYPDTSRTYVKNKGSSQSIQYKIVADTAGAARIRQTLAENLGWFSDAAKLFIGTGEVPQDRVLPNALDNWEPIYGLLRDFNMTVESKGKSVFTLSVEELT